MYRCGKLKVQGIHKSVVYSAVLLTAVALTGCVSKPLPQTSAQRHAVVTNAQGVPNYYYVRAGDTVSHIARRYGLSIGQIKTLNNLDDRFTIYTGQWLKLWQNEGRGQNYSAQNRNNMTRNQSRPAPTSNNYDRPIPATPIPNRQVQATESVSRQANYRYPTSNSIIRQYDSSTGVMGIWFTGQLGDPVFASQSGTVLYAGDGLPEYGNLIMIRHDNEYVTAYAHNHQMLVREGDQVQAGQRIATMGSSGNSNVVALEFQVRRNGRPVDPKTVLQ